MTFAPRQTVEIVPVQQPSQLEGREAETERAADLIGDESAVWLVASARR